MVSLEDYKRLKEKLKQLLTEGYELLYEDEFLLGLFSAASDFSSGLGLAKKLKEEGNSLFKGKLFDDALEKYGYAGVVLFQHDCREEEDIAAFFDLALSILLNFTACLSRKKDFEQVGRICSIILDFDQKNVKAMFRRATAALELGRKMWAYWDLLAAIEVEPQNREIMKKLEEVKSSINSDQQHHSCQSSTPVGLGIGLPSPAKKTIEHLGSQVKMGHVETKKHTEKFINDQRKGKWDLSPHLDDINENQISIVKEGKVPEITSSIHEENIMCGIKNVVQEKVIEDDVDVSNAKYKNSGQVEPKYQFVNRKRPGSSLSISRKDFHALLKGKTIHCFNSRLGSPMTITVVKGPKNEPPEKVVSHGEVKEIVDMGVEQTDQGKDTWMESPSFEPKLVEKKRKTTSSEVSQQNNKVSSKERASDNQSSPPFKHNLCFNSGMASQRRVKNAPTRKVKPQVKGAKKNTTMCKIANSPRSNHIFGCRFQVGMKRKDPPAAIEDNHPRKHPTSCLYDLFYVDYCNRINSMDYSGSSCRIVGKVSHEVAVG